MHGLFKRILAVTVFAERVYCKPDYLCDMFRRAVVKILQLKRARFIT